MPGQRLEQARRGAFLKVCALPCQAPLRLPESCRQDSQDTMAVDKSSVRSESVQYVTGTWDVAVGGK